MEKRIPASMRTRQSLSSSRAAGLAGRAGGTGQVGDAADRGGDLSPRLEPHRTGILRSKLGDERQRGAPKRLKGCRGVGGQDLHGGSVAERRVGRSVLYNSITVRPRDRGPRASLSVAISGLGSWPGSGHTSTTCSIAGRGLEGRDESPTAAIIDSQSVKTGAEAREMVGYDAGKRVKGRKRHLDGEACARVGQGRRAARVVADELPAGMGAALEADADAATTAFKVSVVASAAVEP